MMGEAYLFAAIETGAVEGIVQSCLNSAHAQPGWLDEVHWIGEAPPPLEGKALFSWPESPLLAHFTLQAALRALEADATDLVLVGQSGGARATALLLGAAVVVGRRNLPPLARLTPLACSRPQASGFLASAAACLPEGEAPSFVGLSGLSRQEAQAVFPGVRCLDGEASDFHRVWQLVQGLERSKSSRALLISAAPPAALATLLEKL